MDNQAGASKGIGAMPAKDVPAACLLRIKRDIADFNADPPPGIFIAPEENDVTNINAIVMGAKGTPLEGGFFHFYVQCTDRYPLQPPKVRCMTTDAGRVQFNEHIYSSGHICLSTLNTFGATWSPAQSLSSVLISIQSLLCDVHKFQDKAASDRFESILQHEMIRVAVCDTVEACLQENSPFAQTLKDAVLKKFTEFYDKYESVVKSRLHLTGTQMNDPARFNAGTYQFEKLLTMLQGLKQKVAEKNEAAAAKADT
ncbi:ubiquitin-conjugating enzyme E2 Z-like [Rhipicephalus sanguineus]|uniref:UBC core domain-containing protein n=1 Tax=Rhipicephalus sanguineus TaxID=34632 RepID=A0A9D4SPS7_RHISA|nr:ubiquitin-conjugating enzyme E2 Z-like [Rhipicephalus sanguineus]KAH7936469.1 hypothetical protein HPB52_024188 [Rhipicephalus sanguineus]